VSRLYRVANKLPLSSSGASAVRLAMLRELRATSPNPDSEKTALTTLLAALG